MDEIYKILKKKKPLKEEQRENLSSFILFKKIELFIAELFTKNLRLTWLYLRIPQNIKGRNNTNLAYSIPESEKKED